MDRHDAIHRVFVRKRSLFRLSIIIAILAFIMYEIFFDQSFQKVISDSVLNTTATIFVLYFLLTGLIGEFFLQKLVLRNNVVSINEKYHFFLRKRLK